MRAGIVWYGMATAMTWLLIGAPCYCLGMSFAGSVAVCSAVTLAGFSLLLKRCS